MNVKGNVMTTKVIGNNLRRLRLSRGLTQKNIAEELGVSFQQVQKYETGQNKLPIENLVFLKGFYNVSFETFFQGLKIREGTGNDKEFIQAINEQAIMRRFTKLKSPRLKLKILRLMDIMIAE